MRRPFVNNAGNLGGWGNVTPLPGIMRRLDQYSSELINGDDGGIYTPIDPIVIGQVADFSNPSDASRIQLTSACMQDCDVVTVRGNSTPENPSAGSVGLLVNSPGPVFDVARTRTVVVPFMNWTECSQYAPTSTDANYALASRPLYTLDTNLMAPRAAMDPTFNTKNQNAGIVFLPQRAMQEGATIESVTFNYIIGRRYDTMPANKPKFRCRLYNGSSYATMMSSISGSTTWVTDPALTVNDYYNNGNTRSVTYRPNINNTNLKAESNYVALEWFDDDATIPVGELGNAYLSATVVLASITDMRQE